ncbi:isoleucine--tRNA ligase [Candidatus Falkowbacteria bacterium HGW-Falkowbacteria-1]|uniref:Isoleucine--tRNA ligase n=1 Tax=Candidatus Falkowbacteria bacterium HGW-Falkowbacteria-1 TaxID=2013768 RepID=A0A2N2EA73_9BACT|nr:MAG: isoleucine--tRNA ligase [Candidatus Falkowbacteria bacterium HGW-Falkowbacteria-1]
MLDNDKKIKTEEKVLDFWQKNEIFEKTINKESVKGEYVFYDGPPFATGTPHYGHIVGQIMKDVVPRFFTMNGYRVERKWGWDCHGLPIENIVEKEMGTKSKKEIEEIGVEKFNTSCRSKVLEYAGEWYKASDKLGRFVDKKNAYSTMDLNYMESVWWVFKELWNKDLIYKDYRSMHVCPRCETTLSQSEVTEGYQNIKDLSCVAKFKLLEEENTFVLAWTTTPWTLIGNVALAVGEGIDYVKISHQKEDGNYEYYILAKDRLADVLKDKNYEVIKEFKGASLIAKKYQTLFDYYVNDEKLQNKDNAWKIYSAEFVNTEDGTGIVHIAPAFGQDDMNLGKENNLPFIQHVNMDGHFKDEVKDFVGLNVKPVEDHMSTDIEIIKYLAARGLLFSKEKYEHSYPHCWRCDTPLINYATSSWFVSVTKIKEKLLEEAKNINWSPDYLKEGRFGNWLEGARDWSISRQRFWASPIPIWECACGERKVVGSVSELEELSGEKIKDIHKDKVDAVSFGCPSCGGKMKRIPDVLDCWFESGSMPYAQLHYPFENKDKFEKNFPAEFIAEGVDQTRAWFYYLHVIACGLFGKNAFKNVIVNGIVLAEDGRKMSKRLKNYPDPMLIVDKYGADSLRAYLLSSPVVSAENLNFSEKGVEEALRKNIMLINNIYNFYQMYAEDLKESDLDKYKETNNVLDLWIFKKINILIEEVGSAMLSYNLVKAMRPITAFIDEFSTWYLRRSRDRLKGEDQNDKIFALSMMRFVFLNLSKVIAPFMPFIAEDLWQKITANNFSDNNKSVHLESWPKSEERNEVGDVLELMSEVKKIVELGLAERDKAGIKVRQILNKITVFGAELKIRDKEEYLGLLKDELNVKGVEINDGGDLKVELDIEITEELRLEGVKRDLIRFINLMRKDLDLSIGDLAKVSLISDSALVKSAISKFKEEIKKETLSSDLSEGNKEPENFLIKKEVKIEESEMSVFIY